MIDKYCVYIYSLHYVQREYIYHTTNRREEGNQTLRRSLPAERIRGCFAPPLLLAPVCSRGWNRTTTQAHTRCHKPSVKGRRSSYCRVHTDAMPPSLVSLPCRREVGIRTQLPPVEIVVCRSACTSASVLRHRTNLLRCTHRQRSLEIEDAT